MDNLRGVNDEELVGIIPAPQLERLRHRAKEGVSARHQGDRMRQEALPHSSALEVLDQCHSHTRHDVALGRVLVAPRGQAELLAGVLSDLLGAVPKVRPGRTLHTDKRLTHEARNTNKGTDKKWHPPALQPYHRQVARLILWRQTVHPLIAVLLAKLDVQSAFRLLWVDPDDVGRFATDLPGDSTARTDGGEDKESTATSSREPSERLALGLTEEEGQRMFDLTARLLAEGPAAGLTLISLVLTFGFGGSPGDAPRQRRWDLAQGLLERRGWQVRLEEFIATEAGELAAQKRVVMLAAGPGATKGARPSLAEMELRHPIAPAWGPVIVPARTCPRRTGSTSVAG